MSWTGKILRVDLSAGTCRAEPLNMPKIVCTSDTKLHVTRTPAMSWIVARMPSSVGSASRRRTFARMLSGLLSRAVTCSIGL